MPTHDEGYFSAKDDTRLFWRSDAPDDEPRAHVAIVHGYADHCGRYQGPIDALVGAGFATHAFDYRGHGKADGKRAWAAKWPQFVDDLDVFLERVKREAGGKKIFLLAHSHGALMSIHRLMRDSSDIAGAVFSSPYLRLAIVPPRLKLMAAKIAGRVLPFLPIPTELTVEHLSADAAWQEETRKDPLYLSIATPGWFLGSSAAQLDALAKAGEVKVPTFVFCGDRDEVAAPAAAREFFERMGATDKKFREYVGMRHECLNEVARADVYQDIIGWISARL